MLRAFSCPTLRKHSRRMSLFLSLIVLAELGCRDKNNVTEPGPNPNGSWSIVLDTANTLRIPNDTISVRLFEPDGSLAIGKLLNFEVTVSVDSISQFATTRDTVGAPWGTQSPVYYWGTGSIGGQETPHEIVTAFYVDLQTHDTLARASRSYLVVHR